VLPDVDGQYVFAGQAVHAFAPAKIYLPAPQLAVVIAVEDVELQSAAVQTR
jgi:hypothetical protein